MKTRIVAGAIAFLAGCQALPEGGSAPIIPPLADRDQMPAAVQVKERLSGERIIMLAHEAAGGDGFVRPGTLFLQGYNILRPDGGELIWDRYAMWRDFGGAKTDAHTASGKVRIEGWTEGELALLIAFDGSATYNQDGRMPDTTATQMWRSNFGFGAIRHGLDEGWTQVRQADRLIDGKLAHMVKLTDPSGGETLFGFDQRDFTILYVGFDTPRGWHERRYSNYFTKPGISWKQAGRVRLFYDGVKSNEAIWTDFDIGVPMPDHLFVVTETPTNPDW